MYGYHAGTIKNKAEDSRGATTTITLGRYEFSTTYGTPTLKQEANTTISSLANYYTKAVTILDYFQELSSSSTNTPAKNLKDFIDKTKEAGGYYLARYEASQNGDKPISQANKAVWTDIKQPTAAEKARGMYSSSYFESDLVNSYSWDTAIVFIQKYSNDSNYANKKGTYFSTSLLNTGKAGDVVCNIYDMASNVYEWTTESSTCKSGVNAGPCVPRGGYYTLGNAYYTAFRIFHTTSNYYTNLGFRTICYVK